MSETCNQPRRDGPALASARDEVVRAAKAHCEATHAGYNAKHGECSHPLCAAVAALAKLEGK